MHHRKQDEAPPLLSSLLGWVLELMAMLLAGFQQNVVHMQFDGSFAEPQLLCDLAVGKALVDQIDNLPLSWAKRRNHRVLLHRSTAFSGGDG